MTNIIEYFLLPASPILVICLVAIAMIVVECIYPDRAHQLKRSLAMAGPLLAIASIWWICRQWPINFVSSFVFSPGVGQSTWLFEFGKHYRLDPMTLSFFWAINVFLFFSMIFIEASWGTSDEDTNEKNDVFTLLLFIVAGMMCVVSADSLLMIFVAIELLSLPTYILVGLKKKDLLCVEAAFKYFLFGSFASVILLFAIAVLYAQSGTLHLPALADFVKQHAFEQNGEGLLIFASAALFLVAVGFKVGMAPFHMWVPDTYEGAPAAVTGFMGSAVKLTAFGLVLRLWWGVFLPQSDRWGPMMMTLAVVTMFVGNLAALVQDDLKRMFAYSSISHAGYLLFGVATASKGEQPHSDFIFYYLVTYGLMFLGFFGVLSMIEKEKRSTDIKTLAGMGAAHPILAACLSLFALSAAGIPPTAGFLGKYFIFAEGVRTGKTLFVVVAVISSLIGVYYYLRVIVYLYMKEGDGRGVVVQVNRVAFVAVLACAFSILYFGFLPAKLGM